MASARANAATLPPNFMLTPQQQSLLYAALNSNKGISQQSPANNALSLSPTSFTESPVQKDAMSGHQESPYLDNYDYDYGDSSFDFDFSNDTNAKMIGDIPGTAKSDSTENETDKRSHPDDDEDEDGNENGAKRRESTERVPKKPGRKPLTSEPTSKRKAQNRAAQRAFRERKEQHLKNLETKVQELEKASEDVNHENDLLRAQVEKMNSELQEYKNRFTLMNNRPITQNKGAALGFGSSAIGNLNDVNFQFEFPKFGVLPGPPNGNKPAAQRSTSSTSLSPSGSRSNPVSPFQQSKETSSTPSNGLDFQAKDDLTNFTTLFSPPMSNSSVSNGSRASLDSGHYSLNATATSSPSASSNSNMGASSSCGTSPEPFTQSPMGFKPIDTMATIGEEQSSLANGQGFSQFAGIDINNGIDWLATQNGGQFDPQLFGDYREPQESILAGTTFDDSFFNEAVDADFFTPYNMAPSPALPKKNLISQIDDANNADEEVKVENHNYGKLWEKLQNCPKVQTGEFDLDGLCTDLQKKAKCSGGGPVVSETDFQTVVQKWMGKDAAKCVEEPKTTA